MIQSTLLFNIPGVNGAVSTRMFVRLSVRVSIPSFTLTFLACHVKVQKHVISSVQHVMRMVVYVRQRAPVCASVLKTTCPIDTI